MKKVTLVIMIANVTSFRIVLVSDMATYIARRSRIVHVTSILYLQGASITFLLSVIIKCAFHFKVGVLLWLSRRIRFLTPVEPPRTQHVYNNNMYTLLGYVSQHIAGGTSWEDLIEEHIFSPLGMIASTFTYRALYRIGRTMPRHVNVYVTNCCPPLGKCTCKCYLRIQNNKSTFFKDGTHR